MTRNQSLALAAAIIRGTVPDLRTLVRLLENAGQKRLATELRKQAAPTVRIAGRPRIDTALWASRRAR
jgi:hypothetical protein